jgi:hypothetical protein
MMDVILKDTLPQLRAQGLSRALGDLDDRWFERVLLWLGSEDLEAIRDLDLRSRSHRASLAIGKLGLARTAADFEQALRQAIDLLDSDAALGERRYADLTEHVCRAIVRRRGQAPWLRAALRATAHPVSPALITLHHELVALSAQVPFLPGSPSGRLRAFVVPNDVFFENADRGMLRPYRQGDRWVLDLASTPFELVAAGVPHEIDALTGMTLALTVLRRRLFTSEATSFYQQALGLPRSRGQHHFDRICRRTASPPGSYVVDSGKEARDTPARRAENCLRLTYRAGILIWRDDNTQPWATLTTLAGRFRRRSLSI